MVRRTLFCVSILCAMLVSTPALGGGSAEGPPIDPKADKLLRQMGEYLKSTKQYTFRADVSFDQVLESGQKLLYTARVEASKRRPDRLTGHFKGGDLHEKRFWYDGKSVTVLDEKLNSYATVEVPAEIDAALDHLATRYGFTAPISGLLLNDPYPRLIKNVQSGHYVGLQEIRGVKTHHLAFTQETIDWQIWIQADEKKPVPWMVVITYKDVQSSPQYEARLTEWSFPVRMPESQFTSAVPDNAMKMEFLPLAERPTYSK